jgi:hypothetical protein
MDPAKQRIVLKFLFLKGLEYNAAPKELCSVLGEPIYSVSRIKRWICRFKYGDLSYEEADRPGRPFLDFMHRIFFPANRNSIKIISRP